MWQHLDAAISYLPWSRNEAWVGDCGDGREPNAGNGRQGSVGEFWITALRGRNALACPLVQTAKQGTHDLALRHWIVHLLSACAGRRECGLAVLRTGEQIDSYVVRNRQVSLSVRAGVNERRGATAAPILHGCVREEDFRALLGTVLLEQGTAFASEGLFVRGEREARRRQQNRASDRHSKSFVEHASRRSGDVRPDGVEHAAAALVCIESVVEELSQEPSNL